MGPMGPMGPQKNYREEERACATTSAKFNYFSWGPAAYFSLGPWAPAYMLAPKNQKSKIIDFEPADPWDFMERARSLGFVAGPSEKYAAGPHEK